MKENVVPVIKQLVEAKRLVTWYTLALKIEMLPESIWWQVTWGYFRRPSANSSLGRRGSQNPGQKRALGPAKTPAPHWCTHSQMTRCERERLSVNVLSG